MPILNKAGIFSANDILKDVVGQQESISVEDIMDKGKILICNLSKGNIGEDVSQILGSLFNDEHSSRGHAQSCYTRGRAEAVYGIY